MKHAETHNILYSLQHGTWKRLSCETQLIEFVDDITRNIDAGTGRQTECLIIDLSKAFDKVSHSPEIVKYAIVSSAKSLALDVIPSGMSLIQEKK
jgi:hypothetical protein